MIYILKSEQITQIRKLKKKAENSRNAYFILSRRYKWFSNILHFFVLLGSIIVAILTFADIDLFASFIGNIRGNEYSLIIGLIALVVFILTVIEEFLKLSNKASEYESAGKQLTTFIRYSDTIEKRKEIQSVDVNYLNSYYTMIGETAPTIPDRTFIKSKKALYQKIEISKEIEKNPHLVIWLYKLNRWLKDIQSQLFKRGKSYGGK